MSNIKIWYGYNTNEGNDHQLKSHRLQKYRKLSNQAPNDISFTYSVTNCKKYRTNQPLNIL